MTRFFRIRFAAISLMATLFTVTACTSCDKECVAKKLAELLGRIMTDDLPAKLDIGLPYLIPTILENSFETVLEIVDECTTITDAPKTVTRMRIEYDDLTGKGYRQIASKEFVVKGNNPYSGDLRFAEDEFAENEARKYNDYFTFNRAGKYRITEYLDDDQEVTEVTERNNIPSTDRPEPRSASAEEAAYSFEVEVVCSSAEERERLMALPPVEFAFDSKRKIKN